MPNDVPPPLSWNDPSLLGGLLGAGGGSSPGGPLWDGSLWGLGDLYNMPVVLGVTGAGQVTSGDGQDLIPGNRRLPGSTQKPPGVEGGLTQDLMAAYADMWAQQRVEREKNPNQKTRFERLQDQLYLSGFYGQTAYDKIHPGQWTDQFQNALLGALQRYQTVLQPNSDGSFTRPMTFDEFLSKNSQFAGDGGFYGDDGMGGGGRAPSQVSLADPAALRQAAQDAAQAALGRGLSQEQLDKFVESFHQQQTSAQTAVGGSVVQPNASAQATQFAQQENSDEYAGHQAEAYMSAFLNMFLPAESQRANLAPVASA